MGSHSAVTRVQDEWSRCKAWIEAAANEAPWPDTIEQIEQKIERGVLQFWPGEKAAAVTEIAEINGSKIMFLVLAGGDMTELVTCIEPALCRVAVEMGCSHIANMGREGWKRVCKPLGYSFAYVLMTKRLDR